MLSWFLFQLINHSDVVFLLAVRFLVSSSGPSSRFSLHCGAWPVSYLSQSAESIHRPANIPINVVSLNFLSLAV
ncbi:hypothetical protein F5051DRAFT_413746 [Lentinula edodes]|nr:hypothetical protein F5051DRAFT_413746 [Lentinula edodes]